MSNLFVYFVLLFVFLYILDIHTHSAPPTKPALIIPVCICSLALTETADLLSVSCHRHDDFHDDVTERD